MTERAATRGWTVAWLALLGLAANLLMMSGCAALRGPDPLAGVTRMVPDGSGGYYILDGNGR